MKQWFVFTLLIVGLWLSACGTAVSPPEPITTAAAVATLLPPSLSPTQPPVPTSEPVPTATPVSAPETPTPTAGVTNTPQPTNTSVPVSTATPTPVPDWAATSSRTEDNLMVLGNPDAPISLIDFSDFM